MCSAWAVKEAQDQSSINARQERLQASLLDEQLASTRFDGRFQVRHAFRPKPRPERPGFDVAPAVLGPKAVVQHDHGNHLSCTKGASAKRRIVVESQVVAEPMEGA